MNSPLPFVPRGAKALGMARRHSPRHPLFRQRWFADDIIITCVRWYSFGTEPFQVWYNVLAA